MQQLANGTLLQGGKYRIIRFISSGGFGCTYEAEHILLENRVAIKEFFVKDFCNRDEDTGHITVGTNSKRGLVDKMRRKFVDEARALFRLHHDSIVRVTDVFEENGTAYFVMDYIDGKSLGEVIKKEGALPESRALKYVRQVAEALQYVHDNNRLHLDVKPGNIMIDGNDNALLIDFGASKQYDEEDGENTSTLIGKTPGYAPIEQMGNDVVTFMPATDIYALGATLYKAITGATPPSSNMLAAGEELDVISANISSSTCDAIVNAMRVRKNDRPQSIADFLSILNKNKCLNDVKLESSNEEETLCVNVEKEENIIASHSESKKVSETIKTRSQKETTISEDGNESDIKVVTLVLFIVFFALIIKILMEL